MLRSGIRKDRPIGIRLCEHCIATSSLPAYVCRELSEDCELRGRRIATALNDLAMPSCRYCAVRVSRTQYSINSQAHGHFSPLRFRCAPRTPNTRSYVAAAADIRTNVLRCAIRHPVYVVPLVRPSVLSCALVHQSVAMGISLWLGRSSLCGDTEPHIGPGSFI